MYTYCWELMQETKNVLQNKSVDNFLFFSFTKSFEFKHTLWLYQKKKVYCRTYMLWLYQTKKYIAEHICCGYMENDMLTLSEFIISHTNLLPGSAKQKPPSHRFLLRVEASTIDNRQIGWQGCYMLPCKQSTSSSSTRADFIKICIYDLETESWWF